jgi:uncharacterized integral membrane protein (TIGR00698 family)
MSIQDSVGRIAKVTAVQESFKIVPGILLAAALTILANVVSSVIGNVIGSGLNPFSPVLLSIVFGLLLRNTTRLPPVFDVGVKFGIKKILRLGIILMGIRLSILTALKIGGSAIGLVAVCILAAFAITLLLTKVAGISRTLGLLIAAGTSICGVSAIVALSPVITADEEETAYAIGTITIFGMITALIYPYAVHLLLHFDAASAGFFLGTSVHDTSQVIAASLMYDQLWNLKTASGISGSEIAVTTKLVRNTFMIVIIPLLGFISNRQRKTEGTSTGKTNLFQYVPLFVLGYIATGIVRSAGDLIFGTTDPVWTILHSTVGTIATYLVSTAVACIGLSTDLKKLSKMGFRPLVTGFAAAVSVGVVSAILITALNGRLAF